MNNKKTNRTKRFLYSKIYIIILLFSIILLCFCSYKIFNWYIDNKRIEKINDNLPKNVVSEQSNNEEGSININPPTAKTDDYWYYVKMDMLSADFNELKKKNKDTVGWIKVNGTNINYPVVQTNDNEYYLNHAYDRSKNNAGWIFADYRNNMQAFSKNTIIYGHARLNKSMFGSLKNIMNSNWYNNKDNYIIKFSTLKENTLWQVFSVYSIKAENYYITTDFPTNKQYNTFLQTLKSRSEKHFSAEVNINDKIITLSTCKDVGGTERIVMHAKLIKTQKR